MFVGSWQELVKLKRKEAELHQITAQAQGTQTRLKYSNSELESIRKKSIPACQAVSFHSISLMLQYLFSFVFYSCVCCRKSRDWRVSSQT